MFVCLCDSKLNMWWLRTKLRFVFFIVRTSNGSIKKMVFQFIQSSGLCGLEELLISGPVSLKPSSDQRFGNDSSLNCPTQLACSVSMYVFASVCMGCNSPAGKKLYFPVIEFGLSQLWADMMAMLKLGCIRC